MLKIPSNHLARLKTRDIPALTNPHLLLSNNGYNPPLSARFPTTNLASRLANCAWQELRHYGRISDSPWLHTSCTQGFEGLSSLLPRAAKARLENHAREVWGCAARNAHSARALIVCRCHNRLSALGGAAGGQPAAELGSGGLGKIIGRADREDAGIAADQERPLEQASALVVQKVFVPAIFHQFGNDHDNAPVRMLLREFENVLDDGDDDEARSEERR